MPGNKVYLVTGGNSGLGLETARSLLGHKDARVVVACRDVARSEAQLESVRRGTKGELILLELDLASLESIRTFANVFLERFQSLHCLICNAGVMVPMEEYRKTRDDFEINVGVNHLGHFLLTNLLLDRLKESSPSRIVIVSSVLLKEGIVDPDNLTYAQGVRTSDSRTPVGYSDSKLMNALFALKLAEDLRGSGVAVKCVSPGWCKTRLHQHSHLSCWKYPMMLLVAALFMTSASKGCETIVHCARSSKMECGDGKLFYRKKTHMKEMDEWLSERATLAQRLWEESERLVGL